MILSDISVKRPVLATVISLLLIAFGMLSFLSLPLREYPDIDPPVVSVETDYTGASAAIVETKITRPLEDIASGIEGIKYIQSSSRDGRSEITIVFNVDRDVDAAANDVRDRISRVVKDLPEEADPPQIFKVDANTDVMMWLSLSSSKQSQLDLSDYARRYLVDRFSVIDGVARVRVGGGRDYAMRISLNRQALASHNLTAADIEAALRRENIELPAGRVESVEREFTARVERSYNTEEDFSGLVIRRGEDGYPIRLKDVANVRRAAEDERSELRGNGQPTIGIGIIKQSKANALAVARAVTKEFDKVAESLPEGTVIDKSYDTTLFIDESITKVYHTLAEAIIVVIAVIFLFLGNARATLIPAVTVPVSLIGSFIFLQMFGFSLNLLTLLALVLAIGLVVDDAIIVLENIHRRINLGEPPLLAAFNGARQVGFAVVATTLVLVAVFIPISFLEGNVGRLFREFAMAMAGAIAISGLVALTLSPMMCSKLLRKEHGESGLARWVERSFRRVENAYRARLDGVLNHAGKVALLVIAVIGLVIGALLSILPKELAPREDRGIFFVIVNAPEGASYGYTARQMRLIEKDMVDTLLKSGEAHRTLVRVPRSFGNTDIVNNGIAIAVLKPWDERSRTSAEISAEFAKKIAKYPGVVAFPVLPQGFGQSGSSQPVQFVLGGNTYEELAKWRDIVLKEIADYPGLTGVDYDYKETKPQWLLTIDKNRAADLGVSVLTIGSTLETMMGQRRVTTYIDRGEEYNVILDGRFNEFQNVDDLANIYVRSDRTNELIPLSNLVSRKESADAAALNRYNRLRAITISGNVAPGHSLGEVLDKLNQVVKDKLPDTARVNYKGESLEYMDAGSTIYFIFTLSLLVVFLLLAAQFESFVHPGVIMLTVPLALAGALAGLFLTGKALNIYSQIGILMLVGLAAKNGILIVEFANQLRDQGKAFREALVEAASLRLRPILMTSIATAVGSVPLLLASGAGAESRTAIGVVIFSGTLFATCFTLFVIPVAYLLLAKRTGSPEATARRLEAMMKEQADA